MKSLRLRQRLTCLLLSFCVVLASVGTTHAEMACAVEQVVAVACGNPPAAAPAHDCCSKAAKSAKSIAPKKTACCALKVTHQHVAPEAAGGFFKWALVQPGLLPPAPFSWLSDSTESFLAAPALRLVAGDSSPPGRLTGWALVLALHQLRN